MTTLQGIQRATAIYVQVAGSEFWIKVTKAEARNFVRYQEGIAATDLRDDGSLYLSAIP